MVREKNNDRNLSNTVFSSANLTTVSFRKSCGTLERRQRGKKAQDLDLGSDCVDRIRAMHLIRYHLKQLQQLGVRLTVKPVPHNF